MLTFTIFLPLLFGLLILILPRASMRGVRWTALTGAFLTLVAALVLWAGFDPAGGLQWRTTVPWIPALNASYDVGVDGLSLPLIALTALLLVAVMAYSLPSADRPKAHSFFFLLMATGLIGVFSAQDLLLFYVFFEVALVPLYFIIGLWGHGDRRYAAMKFFLYTRAGSLAMLLGFLGLYLSMEPHTFSMSAIAAAKPLSGAGLAADLVFLGMLLGFGVKLPVIPLHNWLPDAHVEAPTEGSVILAGIQLKMGAYGFLRIMLGTIPETVRSHGWLLVILAVISMVYGALAALGQRDLKRLVAYTSINHMGYVLLGAAVWALAADPSVRNLAITGALFQSVSHGLLTGGMFFLAGMLGDQAGTRDVPRFGGLLSRAPLYSLLLAVLAFGSLGLPGLSGFVAEFQVLGATVSVSFWAAVGILAGLALTTALYIRVVTSLLMGDAPENMPAVRDPGRRELTIVGTLAGLSILLGIAPALLISALSGGISLLALR